MGAKRDRIFTQKASDLSRDGCGIELWDGDEQIGEVFRWDGQRKMTITLWRENLDLALVEMLITRANEELPPYFEYPSSEELT